MNEKTYFSFVEGTALAEEELEFSLEEELFAFTDEELFAFTDEELFAFEEEDFALDDELFALATEELNGSSAGALEPESSPQAASIKLTAAVKRSDL
jgi:hypothetical protein